MARKPRVDSTAERIRVMQAAPIEPPSNVPLTAEDMPFFASVIAQYARSEWTAHDLELAAMLARTMCDMEREQRALRDEGSVSKTDRGTPVVNPRKTVVQMYAGSILAMRRSLSLHARAQTRDLSKIADRREHLKNIESDADASLDDLLN